jgi:anthranilate synthase component 2
MILLIDNYDSFTYNLYQIAGMINPDIRVIRNDCIDVTGIRALHPSHIIISPGPGFPAEAGISINVIRSLGAEIPLLGICLGHQAVGEAFGGKVVHAPLGPVHGKRSLIRLDTNCPMYAGMPEKLMVGRYHSLVVDRASLPECLQVTAETDDGLVMGLRHKSLPVFGMQFHPESILTEMGLELIGNFLRLTMPA